MHAGNVILGGQPALIEVDIAGLSRLASIVLQRAGDILLVHGEAEKAVSRVKLRNRLAFSIEIQVILTNSQAQSRLLGSDSRQRPVLK